MNKIKSIIFDHDGTLVDTESSHFSIWQSLLAEYQVDFPEQDYIRDCNGIPSIENAKLLVRRYSLPMTADALVEEKERRTRRRFAESPGPLMPGVEACINACLASGLTIAVATGANLETVERSMGRQAFFPLFHNIASADQVPSGKPAPDVYLLAMRRMGLDADQCVSIEDSPTGIASAKAAGLFCIAVPSAYSRHQDLSQADVIIDSIEHAPDIVRDL